VSGRAGDGLATQPNAPGRRALQPHDDLPQRALADAVAADDGDDLAVVDPERNAVDSRETAEALRDVVDLEEQTLTSPAMGGAESAARTATPPAATMSLP
jgi:hypothetical protein